MGGGPKYTPPPVWSWSGGWWANPPQWRRNTGVAGVVVAGISMGVYIYGTAIAERTSIQPRFRVKHYDDDHH